MKYSARVKLGLVVCSLVLGAIFVATADAQSPGVCDEVILDMAQDDELGYRERQTGVLYEGNYNKPVSSSIDFPLLSVSLVRFPQTWNSTTVIRIERPVLKGAHDTIRVRARSMARDHYYQMDGWFYGTSLIDWNIGDVLQHPKAKVKLDPDRVGIYGWYLDGSHKIYVPLRISPNRQSGADSCEVILRTDLNLRGYYYYITRWTQGRRDTVMMTNTPVTSGRIIRIVVPVISGEEFEIDFNANPSNSGTAISVGPFRIRIP